MALRDWLGAVKCALIAPREFFRERTPNLGATTLLVAVVALLHTLLIVGLLLVVVQLSAVVEPTAGELLGAVAGRSFAQAIGAGVLVFFNWVVVSGILHVVIKLLDGDGTFADTLHVVGWSTPVSLLLIVILGFTVFLSVQGMNSYESVTRQIAEIQSTAGGAAILGSIVVLGWQAQIWRAGLRAVHDPPREAPMKAAFLTAAIAFMAAALTAF
ncbi:MAG: hypothetical protein ACI8XM_001520 [Haloarculaceae archaeon]|jgi:hypothetical protein